MKQHKKHLVVGYVPDEPGGLYKLRYFRTVRKARSFARRQPDAKIMRQHTERLASGKTRYWLTWVKP